MTKEEKFIEKAKKNGWEPTRLISLHETECYEYIFSPEFGKAYFGEEEIDFSEEYVCADPSCINIKFKWQYHQHQLLTEIQEGRDPIDYLYKFI